jgi:hypothetical protein
MTDSNYSTPILASDLIEANYPLYLLDQCGVAFQTSEIIATDNVSKNMSKSIDDDTNTLYGWGWAAGFVLVYSCLSYLRELSSLIAGNAYWDI